MKTSTVFFLGPVGKELSTQNLDYITLCKQKRKNDVV